MRGKEACYNSRGRVALLHYHVVMSQSLVLAC